MKNGQITINLLSNIIAFGVAFLINFILTPFIVKELGKEAYSYYPITNNFIMYANLLVVVLNSMAARYVTISQVKGDKNTTDLYMSSVFVGNMVIVLLLTIPITISTMYLEYFINIPTHLVTQVKWLFLLTLSAFLIRILVSTYGIATFCMNRIDLNAVRDIIVNTLKAVLLFGLFLSLSPSLVYIGITNIVTSISAGVIMYLHFKKLLPGVKISFDKFRLYIIKKLMASGFWNSINHLNNILLLGLNLVIANIFLGAAAGADFSIAQVVPNFINSFLFIILSAFVPTLVKNYAEGDRDSLINNAKLANKTLAGIVYIPITFFFVFGESFYVLWIGEENSENLYFLTLLILLSSVITINVNSLFNLNTVLNRLKVPTLAYLFFAVFNILLVIILIENSDLGIFSIPVVNIVTIIFRDAIFTPLYAAYCLKVEKKAFFIPLIRGVLCFIITFSIVKPIGLVIVPSSWIQLILCGLLVGIISITCSLFLLFDKKEVISLISKFTKKS